ncbi:MAG: isochorismatase family protein [Pseudorhodoplanes sp.]
MSNPWVNLVTDADVAVYEAAGFGQPTGLGKRPALLVVDVQYRTAGSRSMPILQAIKEEYRTACGEYAWRAIPNIAKLIEVFRSKSLPVIYPCVAPKKKYDSQGFGAKVPAILAIEPSGYEFVAEIAPLADELTLPKVHASSFFGTALESYLNGLGVDSLVVTGCSTSGCVRATAVDGCSLNYRVMVPEDAVYDRVQVSHAVTLFDLKNKYADVISTNEVCAYLESVSTAVEVITMENGDRRTY